MEIFGVVKKNMISLGLIEANHTNGKRFRVIAIIVAYIMLGYGVCTTIWYFVLEAKTFEEHMEAVLSMNVFCCTILKFYMFVVYLVFIGLFLGVCRFFMAFATDLKSRLIALENVIQQYADDETNQSKSLEAMETTIHEFIEFHSDVKQ